MKITFKNFEDQTEYLMQKAIDIFKVKAHFFPKEFEIKKFKIITDYCLHKHGAASLEIRSDEYSGFAFKNKVYSICLKDLIEKDLQYFKDERRKEQRILIPEYQEQIKKQSEELEKLESELKTKISLVRKYAKVNSVSKMIEESENADNLNREINKLRRKIKYKKEHIISLL